MRPIFFHSARVKYNDAGDALIQRELLSLLRKHGEIRVTSSKVPAFHLKSIGLTDKEVITSSYSAFVFAIFGALIKRKLGSGRDVYLAIAPGDNFGGARFGSYLWSALYPVLALLGLRAFRAGVSFGKMTTARANHEAWQSRFMVFNGFRDHLSLNVAGKYGLLRTGYFPDFALRLPVVDHAPISPEAPFRLALSFRNDTLSAAQSDLLLASLDELLAEMTKDRTNVELEMVVQVHRDRELMHQLTAKYQGKYRCTYRESLDLGELTAIYDRCEFVISNRLHALLLAAPRGCFPIPLLVHDRNLKIEHLLGDNGLSDLPIFAGEAVNFATLKRRLPEYQESVRSMFLRGGKQIEDTFVARVLS